MMGDLCYSVAEVCDDEYCTSWSDDLFFLNLDPVYLKIQKFRDAMDETKRNLERGQAEFDFYMKSRNITTNYKMNCPVEISDSVLDGYGGNKLYNLEIFRWNMYKEMLESALSKAGQDLIKAQEEASCILDYIASSSWRNYGE